MSSHTNEKNKTFRVSNASFNRICSAVQRPRRQCHAQRRAIYAFKENGDDQGCHTETDSHADTSVVSKECLVFHDIEIPVNVSGFDSSLGTVNDRSVVSAALAYDDPTTGEVIILVIHQAIYIPTMDHKLVCPMQLRMNEVMMDDCPNVLHSDPMDEMNAIKLPGMDKEDDYLIPLSLQGVICRSFQPGNQPCKSGKIVDKSS
eukprot:scaffold599524_cov63-Attheya_sp.AAC.1